MKWPARALPALLLAMLVSGCGGDPCIDMSRKAPPEAIVLMKKGYEVSYPVTEDLECELQRSGRWERDG